MDSETTQYAAPHPLNLHLLQTYSSLSPPSPPPKSPVPVEWQVLCGPQHCPVFICPLTGYPGPPRTCAAPRSLQECAGACNRLCGGHWVVRLTETSQPHSALAAEWDTAWGGSPNRGPCQIPTVALHNHSHTGPDIPPGRRDGEGSGCGGGDCVCWIDTWKSLHLAPDKTDTFCVATPDAHGAPPPPFFLLLLL